MAAAAPGNGGADNAVTDTSTGHSVAVAYDTNTATNAANRDYAQPVFVALDGPLGPIANGFAGAASDGLVQLDTTHALTGSDAALSGNVVQVARVRLSDAHDGHGGHGRDGPMATTATTATTIRAPRSPSASERARARRSAPPRGRCARTSPTPSGGTRRAGRAMTRD